MTQTALKLFASRAKNDAALQEILLELHRTAIDTHARTLEVLAKNPHDRQIGNAVKLNTNYISASCNLVAMMRGKRPTHWPAEIGQSLKVMELMMEIWQDINETKEVHKNMLSNLQGLLEVHC